MKELKITSNENKKEVFAEVQNYLDTLELKVEKKDFDRPWGGFFVIDEADTEQFIQIFFPHLKKEDLLIGNKLSPKILVVAPSKRLSWQYHHRRAEIWKLIAGAAGVVTSHTDEELESKELALQDIVVLKQGERHRLVGLHIYGVIAEIWQHTDALQPSNEDDIIRLQDDFGR
jgi:mannose-6-phosphate isomerase